MPSRDATVSIRWHTEFDLQHEQLVELLSTFGDLLPNPLSERIDLDAYATKLLTYADIACAFHDERIVGFLAVYANDKNTGKAHLPILSILPAYQGQGLGKRMLSRALALTRQRGMRAMDLNVLSDNISAHHLYRSCGFRFEAATGQHWTMRCDLPQAPDGSS